MADEEINQIRRTRHNISERCGHDLDRLIAYYKKVEKELKDSGEFRFEDVTLRQTESEEFRVQEIAA